MLTSKKSLFTLVFILLVGCQQNSSGQQQTESKDKSEANLVAVKEIKPSVKEEKTVSLSFRGTVQFIGLEGGFFGIVTDKGSKILPMNLAKEFHQDGAIIEFSGNYKDVMTIQQWGKPFTITKINLIKAGKNKPNSQEM